MINVHPIHIRRLERLYDSGSHTAPHTSIGFSLCSLVTEMCPPASFPFGPAVSSSGPQRMATLPPVPETSTKVSYGFSESFQCQAQQGAAGREKEPKGKLYLISHGAHSRSLSRFEVEKNRVGL